jgi:serine/threonine-protein kinase
MSTARLPIGHVLGNYRLVRTLGEGGGGTVYEGEHVALGRRMALKVLHPEIATPEIVERFFDEARAVNQIRHPNIVDVEDLVRAETGEHYLVMELLAGEDLRSALSRDRVLAPARVSRLGEQIARALAAVHRCGVIHRDL